ncbi:MAG TPA: TonB family protein [Rhodocyclaceae bacterium]
MTSPIDPHWRASFRALAISLALHGVLLWQMPVLPALLAAGSPLQATVRRAVPAVVQEPASPATLPRRAARPVAERAVSPRPVAAPAAALAPAIASEGLDGDGLRAYRLALAVAARRFWHYPEAARAAGVGGRATVRVAVSSAGYAAVAGLAESSGDSELDRAALALIGQATAAAPLAESLRGKTFTLDLPVVFETP